MNKEIKEYIRNCADCQKAKSPNKTLGSPNPFPPPMKKWEEISMDYLFDLPKTENNKSGILVVVDKLSKLAHFYRLSLITRLLTQPVYSTNKFFEFMVYQEKLFPIEMPDLLAHSGLK